MKYSEEQIIEKLKEFKNAFIAKNEKIKELEAKLETALSEKNSLENQLKAKSNTELLQANAKERFDEELSKLIEEAQVLIAND